MRIKFFKLLYAVVFFSMVFVMNSCGGDEPTGEGNSGKKESSYLDGNISVLYEWGETLDYYVAQARWDNGKAWQEDPSTMTEVDHGGVFSAAVSTTLLPEDERWLYESGVGFSNWDRWQFSTSDALIAGKEVMLKAIFWLGEGNIKSFPQESGTVKVKSVKNGKITLTFDKLIFERIRNWRVGDSEYDYVTILDGEITFSYED